MQRLEFFVPSPVKKKGVVQPMPGLNELIRAAGTSKFAYERLKGGVGRATEKYALEAAKAHDWKTPATLSRVTLTFVERNHRRDLDNIFGGAKAVIDGITRPRAGKKYGAGIIVDDSQRWCYPLYDVAFDAENMGVYVCIEAAE